MKKSFSSVIATAAVLGCGLLFSMQTASADVVGLLVLDGGLVTVTATNLSWTGTATVQTPTSTLTYGAGNTLVANGTAVTLLGLPGTLPTPISDFMSFGIVNFTLDIAGPGSSNTNCSAAGLLANSGECSAFAGSPIVLSQAGTDVEASLALSGTVSDGIGTVNTWAGAFDETVNAAQIGGSGTLTPLLLQQYFGGPGNANSNFITTSYSGTFSALVTPEPTTIGMTLVGGSLILLAGIRRRRRS